MRLLSPRVGSVLKMADSFERFSPNDVCDFVKDQVPNISQDVLDNILQHKIDGEVFLALNDEYLREIAPLLGLAVSDRPFAN